MDEKEFVPVKYLQQGDWLDIASMFVLPIAVIVVYVLLARQMRRGPGGLGGGVSHPILHVTPINLSHPLHLPLPLPPFSPKAGPGGARGPLQMGKISPSKINAQTFKTRFADVAGLGEAKVEVKEFVSFLNDPSKFRSMGAKVPKVCLLWGAVVF